jgi:hypothetical protein
VAQLNAKDVYATLRLIDDAITANAAAASDAIVIVVTKY